MSADAEDAPWSASFHVPAGRGPRPCTGRQAMQAALAGCWRRRRLPQNGHRGPPSAAGTGRSFPATAHETSRSLRSGTFGQLVQSSFVATLRCTSGFLLCLPCKRGQPWGQEDWTATSWSQQAACAVHLGSFDWLWRGHGGGGECLVSQPRSLVLCNPLFLLNSCRGPLAVCLKVQVHEGDAEVAPKAKATIPPTLTWE